jgi:phage gp46-like protein
VLSLTIRKGSWWYKVEFGLDWNDRAKLTARSEIVLREKIKDALKWMFRTGLLEAVEVETWKLRQGVLAYHVKATSKDKRVVEYENFVGVI